MSVQLIPASRPQTRKTRGWFGAGSLLPIAALTVLTLLVHGYHPLAEDGGLYVAGVEFTLNRALFPHFTEFVSEHLRFSIFAPLLASVVRLTHLPLSAVLFGVDLLSIGLTLAAARALLRRTGASEGGQLAGVAMLAALWTLPVAGTSLLLMDPYVTARSLSTPLSLWAIVFALDEWGYNRPGAQASGFSTSGFRSLLGCALTVMLAGAFHPLMAGYALGLVVVLRALRRPRGTAVLIVLGALTMAAAGALQAHAAAETPAVVAACITRYYWFLSQWHWYELLGLAGPLLVFGGFLLQRPSVLGERGKVVCVSAILYGCFATVLTALFAHESYRAHIVARMQPLRAFLLLYLLMVPLLGAALVEFAERITARSRPAIRAAARGAVVAAVSGAAVAMFVVQRNEFPASMHLELPWRAQAQPNRWVQAFLWSREHTPTDALFAIDARYITTSGEDAQTFRAIARRSVLPDYSKDGGEAAITPVLADEWAGGVAAQTGLNQLSAAAIRARLLPLGVSWVILRSDSPAKLGCPYNNGLLRVCPLRP